MTKFNNDAVMDAALDEIIDNANELNICSVAPTTRTEAITTYMLADVVINSGDFTKADGDTSGRKATVAAQNGVTVDNSGMGTHVAITDATRLLHVTEMGTVRQNTAQAGGASTITLDASASAVDDEYNDMAITIVSGTGAGQTRYISDYVGSTKVATVGSAWSTQPDATSVFRIYGTALTATGTVNVPAYDIEIEDPA
ncbi:MAG: hypothetical protein DWQ04_07030 [Chloroflexi bacterium]|nr:MAG: hypothetical protein DWQ04_07030 [Chloroflexota bacterium]